MLCTELCNCWGGSRSQGKSLSHLNMCSYQIFCYVAKKKWDTLGWTRIGYMNTWWGTWSRNLYSIWKTCSHYRKTSLKIPASAKIWTSTYWSLWQTYFILSRETLTPLSLYQLSILHTLLFLDVKQFLWSQFLLLLAFLHLYHAQSLLLK